MSGNGNEPRSTDPLPGSRVLLVEDEFIIALDLQILLYRLGCDVMGPVGSVAEALVLLRHDTPDAALLDLVLRDGLAVPIAQRLRDLNVPFMLATGRSESVASDEVFRSVPILSKPVDENELRRRLSSLIKAG